MKERTFELKIIATVADNTVKNVRLEGPLKDVMMCDYLLASGKRLWDEEVRTLQPPEPRGPVPRSRTPDALTG
jgi:hypothetical protein